MTVKSVVSRAKGFARLAHREEGQALVEYALLVSLVAMAAFVAVEAFGQGVAGLYSNIVAQFPS